MKYDRDTVKSWAADSQWKALQADYARFRMHGYTGWGSEGFWALSIFRLQKAVGKVRLRWIRLPAVVILTLVKKIFVILTGVDLHPDAEIGPGLLIPHGAQIRVPAFTSIGADCALNHLCTIGAGIQPGSAKIGDHVYISPHSCILGPVTIGDGATIAACTLVLTDIPEFHTAIGVPARILPLAKDRQYGYSNRSVQTASDPPKQDS